MIRLHSSLMTGAPVRPHTRLVNYKTFHTDVATALYLANRTKPTITLVISELCKRIKAPTTEDDKKLDRLICYLRATRDIPLRLGYDMPPRVTVSIERRLILKLQVILVEFVTQYTLKKNNSEIETEMEMDCYLN